MHHPDLPNISNSTYAFTNSTGADWTYIPPTQTAVAQELRDIKRKPLAGYRPQGLDIESLKARAEALAFSSSPDRQPKKEDPMPQKGRIVRVFVIDPDENIPLDKSFVHKGEEQLTDLNDQELFFEIGIKEKLEAHNAFRLTVRDKKASEKLNRDVMLEPTRIKDLNMLVVTIAAL